MKHIIKVGAWFFEIKQIRAIKAPSFGMPYTATALITVVNGEPVIENLLSKEGFSRNDFKDIQQHLNNLGFKKADWRRFCKNGNKRVRINNDKN